MPPLHHLLIAPLLIISLLSCSEAPQQPIRLGTNVWPGYEPLYLAQHLDLIKPDEVRLVEYPSASEVIRAFRNRSLEAAALTLDEALLLQQDGIPVSVILVMDISAGGDVIMARQEVVDIAALKGKRVGVESSALGAYVIARALEIHGMSLTDIEVRHLEVSVHEAAYRNGEIDAAVTFEPVRTQLLSLGAHEIFNSREMPGEIVDVLVVHRSLLERPTRLVGLMDGWFAALDYLKKQPQSAAAIIARRLNISPAEALGSYARLQLPSRLENQQLLAAQGQLYTTLERLSATMRQNGLLRGESPTAPLLYDAIVN